MLKTLGITALAAAALAGCTPAPSPEPDPAPTVAATLGQPFELRPGQRAVIAGEELTVRFTEVAGDSRCPTGAQCIQAGNAVVRAVLSRGGKGMGTELSTDQEPRSTPYLTYTVELVSLAPRATARGGAVQPSRYRAAFVVRRA
jgi:hypothetical protein